LELGTWRNRIVEEKEKAVRNAVIAVVAHQQRVNHRMWLQVDAAVHRTLEGYRTRLDKMTQKLQPLHHYVAKLQFENKRYKDIYNLLVQLTYCHSFHFIIQSLTKLFDDNID
jgi:hypothetical protein